jgi:hypothetical protein
MTYPENTDHEDSLKAENAFLQMKLMLETGAQFPENDDGIADKLPAEIENQFLKNIIAFNEFSQNPKLTTVYKKIGSPEHFKPADQIPDSQIEQAWRELSEYLGHYGVALDVCSPNIGMRELYRFTLEELFQHEMEDMDLPGWSTNFIYDEFHPDHVYDNSRVVIDDVLPEIFRKAEIEYFTHYSSERIQFNERKDLDPKELRTILNGFKASFDHLHFEGATDVACAITGNRCVVTGLYAANGDLDSEKIEWRGNFRSELTFSDATGYWYVTAVRIGGILL